MTFRVENYADKNLQDVLREYDSVSPTDPPSFMVKPSVGLLKITKETITPQIINL